MGSKKTGDGVENVYAAAEKLVERALRNDDSLFTPGKAIWSSLWLADLRERLLDKWEWPEDKGGFGAQLEKQLAGSPHEVHQLMAEMSYVHLLIVWRESMKPDTKLDRINEVLGWSDQAVTIPDDLVDGLTPGIAGSQSFARYRLYHLGFLIEFAEQWKEQDSDERQRLLEDPWAFKDFVKELTFRSQLLEGYSGTAHRVPREALYHLVFPDHFEGMVSVGHKERIAGAQQFAQFTTQPTDDVDRRLQQIRKGLETYLGRDFDFWDPDIKGIWDDNSVDGNGPPPPPPPPPPEDPLKSLANDLHLPVEFLREIETLLNEKKQVIFQGPPGTGKTYVAQELAEVLAGSEDRVTLVQFHPSYAYEDFVQGFRPTLENGQPGFKLRNGPLLSAAKSAKQKPDEDHFLVIDEINRGNIAKIFGELYFLLEYRDREMRLQYSDKPFSLPRNLYFIGTMNTADRSIALVDLALRRRFYFKEFHPDEQPVKDVLRKWLNANEPDANWVADLVERANEKLNDRDAAIGPSYFMQKGLDEDKINRIWEHSVLPYVQERLFGEDERIAEFRLDKLRREGAGASDNTDDGGERAEQQDDDGNDATD